MSGLSPELREQILRLQKTEITEYHIYRNLARKAGGKNGEVLEQIAFDERRHSEFWRRYTGTNLRPDRIMVFFYLALACLFGITFAIKIMEKNEESAEETYAVISEEIPEARNIMQEEGDHEKALVKLLDEERLKYIGSMVLGLNDALVELTGALAGFTFALADSRIVVVAGLITGVAATLSMGASEFLSQRSESGELNPLKAAIYTGVAYLITVTLLVAPFFILGNVYGALFWALGNAFFVIIFFSFFLSIVREIPFRPAFLEMAAISFGVAAVSFLIGLAARRLLPLGI
ncbi:MAG TPA: rubrerythrin family protein [Synergistaceae bacterium]|nr:rubrerythrin family protein [Synergistaceae bacterium]